LTAEHLQVCRHYSIRDRPSDTNCSDDPWPAPAGPPSGNMFDNSDIRSRSIFELQLGKKNSIK